MSQPRDSGRLAAPPSDACRGRFAVANRVGGDAAAIAWERARPDERSRLRRSRRTTAGSETRLRAIGHEWAQNGYRDPGATIPLHARGSAFGARRPSAPDLVRTSNLLRASLEAPYSVVRSHRPRIKTRVFAGAFSSGANRDRTGDLLLANWEEVVVGGHHWASVAGLIGLNRGCDAQWWR